MSVYMHSIIVSTNVNTSYDASLQYFLSLSQGYTVANSVRPSLLVLKRGSFWGTGVTTIKTTLTINLSSDGENTAIQCNYDFPTAIVLGRDKEYLGSEVEGLKNFILTSQPQPQQTPNKDRVCVECKRNIPFDANVCPYCGHDYRKV